MVCCSLRYRGVEWLELRHGVEAYAEQGKTMGGMIQFDRDAVAAIDIPAAEKAVAAGKGAVRNGVPIVDPAENAGVLTLIPVPKNPHGISQKPAYSTGMTGQSSGRGM